MSRCSRVWRVRSKSVCAVWMRVSNSLTSPRVNSSGAELRASFAYLAAAASLAAAAAPARGRVAFQGHVLEVRDFLATWVVELALHHLDLLNHPRVYAVLREWLAG